MSQPHVTGVTLAGFDLNTPEGAAGAAWRFINVKGWFEPAPNTVDQTQRTGHGVYGAPGRAGARVVTIRHKVEGTRAQVAQAIELMSALLADGSTGVLETVDRDLGLRLSTVRRLTVDPEWNGGPVAFFTTQLVADDPAKYGEESTETTGFAMPPEGAGLVFPEIDEFVDFGPAPIAASVTIQNTGLATAYPVFEVNGPTDGFRILDTTTQIPTDYLGHVRQAGPSEPAPWVLDTATGATLLDGVNVRPLLRVTQWPEIPACSQRTYLFEPLTSATAATLTARVRATYR